jgi:hypothetical protein
MKGFVYLIFVLICSIGCMNKEDWESDVLDIEMAVQRAQEACGQSSTAWLSEMLQKAEEDRLFKAHNGSFIGFVSMVKHQNHTVFYTNFMSKVGGGLMFFLMDCQGNQFDASAIVEADPAFFPNEARKKGNIIYSNISLELFDQSKRQLFFSS